MSLEDQLLELERRRNAELRLVTFTYARLKHDVHRKLSPGYYIRKHVWSSLTTAGTLGFLLAPDKNHPNIPHHRHGRFLRLILRLVPGLHELFPTTPPPQQQDAPAPSPKHSGIRAALADILLRLLRHLDWSALFAAFTHAIQNHKTPPAANETPPSPAPSVD